MSSLVYPHTKIQEFLSDVAANSSRWGERAKVALAEYKAKRSFWTSRIAELEAESDESDDSSDFGEFNGEYPHTKISDNLDRLRASLKASGSPERQARLDLVDAIEADYARKRSYLDELMSHFDVEA